MLPTCRAASLLRPGWAHLHSSHLSALSCLPSLACQSHERVPLWFSQPGVLGTSLSGASLNSWGAQSGVQTLTAEGEDPGFEFPVEGHCAMDGVCGKKCISAFATHFFVVPFHLPEA